ncbi:MAG: hypothetical protein IPK82_32110 [Polyangiaceae bacterium]|nr:hypothetical protein [Polyangiaceae bacterium]
MCGKVCSFANATAVCNGGNCQIGTCNNGFADCDGMQNNGCEVQLGSNINNCGACGNVCNATNASNVTCNNGDCKPMCLPGFGDCDAIDGNGCETNLKTNPNNCNACGVVCPANGGSPFCTNGVCGSTNCNPGTGDCNGDGMCETQLNTTNNCGACGNACSTFHATPSCSGTPAICQLSCEMGWDNCNGNVNDGCEQTLTSNSHCGACNAVCSINNASTSCASGTCTFVSCLPGFANCNNDLADGCETQLATSNLNCGQCGNTCNPANGTGQCVSGQCTVQSCNNGFGNCNGSAADGCETDIYTPPHCGSCASACSFPNAGAFCSPPSSCQLGQCNPDFLNCNGNTADGCEVNGLTIQNCGACGNQCANINGVASCNGGSCDITCAPGFGNCDGLFSNGCETALNTLMDCGSCGNPCVLPNAVESCNSGSCVISACDPNFTNCDNFTGNGCECGNMCSAGQCQGCGDGQCTGTETCTSCPNDCGSCNCGNNICDMFETCANCPGDCCCGDLVCDMASEDCMSCPADCGICSSSSSGGGSCGDGTCDGGETCLSCAADCCCGNGICDIATEDCMTCPQDCMCGSSGAGGGAVCGNTFCESPDEDCATCPVDCGACMCGSHPGVECDSQGTCSTGSGNGCCRLPGGNESCTVPFMCTQGSGKHYACDEKSDCAGGVCCSPLTGGATCKASCPVGESELCFNPTMGLPSCECSNTMDQCCPVGGKNAFYPTCQPAGPCL